jgi:hypothetical protein
VNHLAEATNVGNLTTKKRTLFSAAQNTMLESSFISPAGVIRKKGRFNSQNNETTFLPPAFSTQASATMMDLTRKRRSEGSLDDDDDSDLEIEFKRPPKIIRTNMGEVNVRICWILKQRILSAKFWRASLSEKRLPD